MMEFSSSSKRAKTPVGIVSCLVDGCNADLGRCREYHRRHKVCELHSKTPMVTIAGRDQRFCQQCSRFHSLTEFDEGKRSCRKRLDGHNRRRRKPPQSDPTFLPSQQGIARLLSFGGSQVNLSSVVASSRFGPPNNQPPLTPAENNHLSFLHPLSSNRPGSSSALSLLSSPLPAHQTPAVMSPIPSGIRHYGFEQPESSGMFNDDSSSTGIKQPTLSFRWE